ncbi:retinol dehydrogenase [Virgisporangium aliadipatigenens]|uniref:Retinol dehydrogenase n=1 Tax=Virgisporangium aliadipatigenens TaxID=741659 RepID=A0A8J3YH59_9ACTN|nr:SDR family NAD(P)-dependent oxidoreductase [Virgisporangium aliadipatigenens]GIJ44118.1 retinol dehydrogenase [Virgisporangium aliadipatigenens]
MNNVSVVTGATGDMGRVVAAELVARGDTVLLVVRNAERGRRIAAQLGFDRVEVFAADLTSPDDVHHLAGRISARHPELHLLVNNAGAHFRTRDVNDLGVELHVAVNFLAGFLLTERLLGALKAGAPSRVVNVVSDAINDTRQVKLGRAPRPVSLEPFDDLTKVNPDQGFQPFTAYARAKLLTVMNGYALADRLADTGVTVNSVHPGVAATGIVDDMIPSYAKAFRGMMTRGLLPPKEGARAILHVATAPALEGVSGRYFNRFDEARTPPVSHDRGLQQQVRDAAGAYLRRTV